MKRIVTLSLVTGLSLTVAACAEPAPEQTLVPPPRGSTQCDAGPAQRFIGQQLTSFTTSDIRIQSNAQSTRVLTPDMAATMDFRGDRVNIYLDKANVVTRITCG